MSGVVACAAHGHDSWHCKGRMCPRAFNGGRCAVSTGLCACECARQVDSASVMIKDKEWHSLQPAARDVHLRNIDLAKVETPLTFQFRLLRKLAIEKVKLIRSDVAFTVKSHEVIALVDMLGLWSKPQPSASHIRPTNTSIICFPLRSASPSRAVASWTSV